MNCYTIYSSLNNCFSIIFTAHMNPVAFYLIYQYKYLARNTLPYFPAPNYLKTWKSLNEGCFPFEPKDRLANEFYSEPDLFSLPRKGLVIGWNFWPIFSLLSNFYKVGDWNFYKVGDWNFCNAGDGKDLNLWNPPSLSFYLSLKKASGDYLPLCKSNI